MKEEVKKDSRQSARDARATWVSNNIIMGTVWVDFIWSMNGHFPLTKINNFDRENHQPLLRQTHILFPHKNEMKSMAEIDGCNR